MIDLPSYIMPNCSTDPMKERTVFFKRSKTKKVATLQMVRCQFCSLHPLPSAAKARDRPDQLFNWFDFSSEQHSILWFGLTWFINKRLKKKLWIFSLVCSESVHSIKSILSRCETFARALGRLNSEPSSGNLWTNFHQFNWSILTRIIIDHH